jgi:uncharacterized membrane protein HdeD (DUF308 family)
MIFFIKVILFALLFVVSTNLQILAQVEKKKRDKNIAIISSVLGAILLGIIVFI